MRTLTFFLCLLFSDLAQAKNLKADPVLFHSGSRKNMDGNIRANTIPEKAWNDFVMGKTNFDLPEYRKGLYGAEALTGTSLYSLYRTLGGGEPWVIAVRLKESCLDNPALFAEEYEISEGDPNPGRFQAWYSPRRAKYRALEKRCLQKIGDHSYWETGALYDLAKADAETRKLTLLCTPVILDFFRDTGVKIFIDRVNDDSWAIRDRACITGIEGTPDDLFRRLLTNRIGDGDFLENFFGDAGRPGTYFAGNLLLFLGVAAETSLLEADALDKLRVTLDPWIAGDNTPDEQLSIDSNADAPKILWLALLSAARAVKEGGAAEWQKKLREFLISLRTELGHACEGKNGVPASKREACSKVTAAQSNALVSLLKK